MTQSKRIFLNVVATYGRSLYSLVLGLFSGRWALMALGQVDYGLLGVVGGLTFFIAYFNTIITGSISRFYAVSVGSERSDYNRGIEECRRWFTTAVVLQTSIPTFLMIVGYPIGVWAIRDFLTIPPDRVADCIWVWRATCFSCYLGMVSIPLRAMYEAHQYIAELTIYSFATSTLNFIFLYYIVNHPGVWLVQVAFWGCFLSVLPNIIIAIRAIYLFPECRIVKKYLNCWSALKQLAGFMMWNAWGILGEYLRGSGLVIVVNKFFGPKINAGMSIGLTLSGHCNTLASSFFSAFTPAISNAWGAKDYDMARALAYRICKVGTLAILVFALPMMLEVDEVLQLWLKNPPPFASHMCLYVLVSTILTQISIGHMYCVNANGKVAGVQAVSGTLLVLTLPFAVAFIYAGFGLVSIGLALVLNSALSSLARVYFAHRHVGMRIGHWCHRVLAPLVVVSVAGLLLGYMPSLFMSASFLRVCVTTFFVEATILPISWLFILDSGEKEYIVNKLRPILARFHLTSNA